MLTPRLEAVFKHVTGSSVADIGTDHAYIPIELVKRGICNHAIAADIKPGPLKIAQNNISKENLNIETRLGGGLSVINKDEVQDIIIAGMGGKVISLILNEHMEKAKSSRLILQPMNAQYELRKFLTENGFNIQTEDLATEGFKVYNIIVCDRVNKKAEYKTELDYHIPSFLKENPHYKKLVEKKVREFTKIIKGNEKMLNSQGKDSEKGDYYKFLLHELYERESI